MNCDWTERISQLIDGELSEVDARAIQRHLNDCHECQQARADFLQFRSEIASYIPALDAAAQANALARILGNKQQTEPSLISARSRWQWSFNPRFAAAAAVVLLAAIVGFVVYRSVETREQTVPRVARTLELPSPPTPLPSQSPVQAPTDEKETATANSTPARKRTPRPASVNLARSRDTQENPAVATVEPVAPTGMQSLTALHLQKAELLLRAFRNVRTAETGSPAEIAYERKQAQQLILRNMVLWREADLAGEIEVASLLENLEPILLDIANLPDEVSADDIRLINDRVERKNIVALLQVNSTVLARALDD